ncbi:MAG: pyruvate ferredoxin oxidoreductase [Candidatus Diapherotrites archaeon]|nr:pyruvate ferredoxin oxidoreductase [Candidatus Diapherotrites archaeon]
MMTKKIMEGSHAVAEAVKLVDPEVLAMYPITPSTHIPERLSEMKADGEISGEFIPVESEFSALSACVGATATGVRSYTATSSQGLALMHEVIFAAAGMRLPVVITVANRALSAPLNIFNDWQDSVSERDSGWVQVYAESNQEAHDNLIQSYRIAEDVLLPVMNCMDGFYLTHTYEPVDLIDDLGSYLPPYKPKHAYLDPERPITQGAWALANEYYALRKELNDVVNASLGAVKKAHDEFAAKFGRAYGNGLIEEYKNDRGVAIVSMGSLCGTIKDVVDSRDDAGLVRVRCYRPFPKTDLKKALEGKERVIIIEKDVALGLNSGALYSDVRDALYGSGVKVFDAIVGLGGKDVPMQDLNEIINRLKSSGKDTETIWLGVD